MAAARHVRYPAERNGRAVAAKPRADKFRDGFLIRVPRQVTRARYQYGGYSFASRRGRQATYRRFVLSKCSIDQPNVRVYLGSVCNGLRNSV